MDNDGYWEAPDTLTRAVDLFNRHQNVGALYTAVKAPQSRNLDAPVDGMKRFGHRRRCKSSSFRGGASAIRTDLFQQIGGFPSHYFRQGEEEYLSLLIHDSGYNIVYAPDMVLLHYGSDYEGKKNIVEYNSIRNAIGTKAVLYPGPQLITKVLPRLCYRMLWYFGKARFEEGYRLFRDVLRDLISRTKALTISTQAYQRYQQIRCSDDDWLYDLDGV
jgi:GT2 family glycosyltransferase